MADVVAKAGGADAQGSFADSTATFKDKCLWAERGECEVPGVSTDDTPFLKLMHEVISRRSPSLRRRFTQR
eukprot:1268115-Amphidinium_carterae.2